MKKKYVIILFCSLIILKIIGFIFILGLFFISIMASEIEINTDVSKYNDYIGINAKKMYQNKWGMDEKIFPEFINDNMVVEDYKMVYYNPWDAQYLSYLVIDYDYDDYIKEVDRLRDYPSTNYKGYYGAKGFDKYILLAMQADSYHGFVYAITDGDSKIIYVELIFCNYQLDIDYLKYIDKDYLPIGFDARENNYYQKKNS